MPNGRLRCPASVSAADDADANKGSSTRPVCGVCAMWYVPYASVSVVRTVWLRPHVFKRVNVRTAPTWRYACWRSTCVDTASAVSNIVLVNTAAAVSTHSIRVNTVIAVSARVIRNC